MRNGRAIGKQRCVQKSGQWRAEEELRSFPYAEEHSCLLIVRAVAMKQICWRMQMGSGMSIP